MNIVLIRDGIKLKMPIELDPNNDPSDEVSALQEIAERLGFDTYDLEDAAPVRTKDLTDDEIAMCMGKNLWNVYKNQVDFARAVIAADREKNK